MGREAQDDRSPVQISRGDEEHFAAFQRFDVKIRREVLTPRLHDIRRIVGWPDRTNRISVRLSDRLSVVRVGSTRFDPAGETRTFVSHAAGMRR
jgi:hypothetical protein